jgi:siroheme synthase-like protein
MLIDLRVDGNKTIVIGGGVIGEQKAKSLAHHGSEVTVISETFTPALIELGNQGTINLVKERIGQDNTQLRTLIEDSMLVFAATDDPEINQLVSRMARESKVLVCAVDMPDICDFYSPAVFQNGSIRVGICTDGKSPIMSKVLKQRLSDQVTEVDGLNLELQFHSRELAKKKINDRSLRRDTLYKILNDPEIQTMLGSGKLDESKIIAERMIEEASQYQSRDDKKRE